MCYFICNTEGTEVADSPAWPTHLPGTLYVQYLVTEMWNKVPTNSSQDCS